MNKKILAVIALSIIILCTFSSCRQPNNSGNGNNVVPGAVSAVK